MTEGAGRLPRLGYHVPNSLLSFETKLSEVHVRYEKLALSQEASYIAKAGTTQEIAMRVLDEIPSLENKLEYLNFLFEHNEDAIVLLEIKLATADEGVRAGIK